MPAAPPRNYAVQNPLSDLFDRWAGQPILVIGGGPSVTKDLPKLAAWGVKPGCVISANDHGRHQKYFPLDLAVNCDKLHCLRKLPMEGIMRALGVPVINRHSWANYRLVDWSFAGNSGLTAVAVACALGGHPVIVTGIDMWNGGRLYFHDGSKPKPLKERHMRAGVTRHDLMKLQPLKQFAQGAHVRPVSGPLTSMFPAFDPAEKLPASKPVAYRATARAAKLVHLQATNGFMLSSNDVVRLGHHMVFSEREVQRNPRLHGKTRPLAI